MKNTENPFYACASCQQFFFSEEDFNLNIISSSPDLNDYTVTNSKINISLILFHESNL